MQTIKPTSIPTIPGEYWQWRGHNVYYVQAGNKQLTHPPLLLVHGFGASTDHWRKNIHGLQNDFAVYAIDLLGYGRSAKPKLEYGGDLWRDQLYDFITQIIGEPAVLAGNSLGGYASLCLAAQCPEAAKGVILLNSAGPFSAPPNQLRPNPTLIQKLVGNSAKWVFQRRISQYLLFQYLRNPWVIRRTLKKVYLDHSAITDELVADIHRPSCDVGAFDVFSGLFSNRQGEKVDILLQQLTLPLMLIWGEGDPWMNSRLRSEQFKTYYPDLTEHFVNAGHCPHDEVPKVVNQLIREWVQNL